MWRTLFEGFGGDIVFGLRMARPPAWQGSLRWGGC